MKSWPDYVGAGGGGERAVSAFTFYTKGFTNVSQASVCGLLEKINKLLIKKNKKHTHTERKRSESRSLTSSP